MKDEVNSQPVKLVIEHIKKQIAERQILPGERLPSGTEIIGTAEGLAVPMFVSFAKDGVVWY